MMKTLHAPTRPDRQQDNTVALSRYVDVVMTNRKLVLSVACAVFLAGACYAFLSTPVYQADILIQVEDSVVNPNPKGPLGDASNLFEVKPAPTGEMELLRSRTVIGAAVDKLKLYIDAAPRRLPLIGDLLARHSTKLSTPGLFGQGGYAWGAESIGVGRFEVPDNLEGKSFRVKALGDGRFTLIRPGDDAPLEGQVGQPLTYDTDAGPVTLLLDSLQGNPGTQYELVRHSREKMIDTLQDKLYIAQRGKESGMIGVTLDGTDRFLTPAILNDIGDAYVKQNVERKSAEADRSLGFLNALLPKLKGDLENAELRYNALRSRSGTFNVGDDAKATLEESVAARKTLLELEQKRADLVHRYTPQFPEVAAVNQQISNLNQRLAALAKKSERLPSLEQSTLRLMRDVQVDNELYIGMLNNIQQLKVVQAGKVGSVRVFDRAVVEQDPIKPNRTRVMIYAAIAGLLLGIMAAFARWTMRGGVTDPADIEQSTGLDVFATVPLMGSGNARLHHSPARPAPAGPLLLTRDAPTDPLIESLRSLRATLHFSMPYSGNNRIMLTGPTDGVGKSFLSANLATVMSTAGKRVLLIDADMRRGHLDRYFKIDDPQPGLSDFLAGKIGRDKAVRRNVMNGLDFIPRGSDADNPAELLLGPRIDDLLSIGEDYDIVLIDTPPVLAVSDATAIASQCGTVLLVTRFEETSIHDVTDATKRLKQANSDVQGVVFNGFDLKATRYSTGSGRRTYASYLYSAQSPRPAVSGPAHTDAS